MKKWGSWILSLDKVLDEMSLDSSDFQGKQKLKLNQNFSFLWITL